MFSIGSSDPAGSPQTPWLIRIGIFSAGAMAAALVMALWAMLVTDAGAAPGAVALLLCGTAASIASACLVSHVILRLAEREQRAANDAGHDLLSGLANRKLFHSWIDYELARRRREGSRFAVMYLDIDHFKDINDRHGHDAGDRLIVEVARRLSDTLRPTDRLARFGGDEFAILQSGIRTINDAEALASRIVDAMRQPFSPGRIEVTSSASIGIAMCPDNAESRDDLMKLADLALYRAKKDGRDRFAFFDARMGEDLARRRSFGLELAAAIASDSLSLEYQPVFRVGDRKMLGIEARLRWAHPQRGLIDAADMTSIAEERGLLLPLGHWVLQRACMQARAWPDLRLCVSVSPVHFRYRDFAAQVLKVIHETGLDPARLDLCIDESCLLGAKAEPIAGMKILRQEGVRFTLAQFGAGVASLNYVRQFPLSRIKIDQQWTVVSPDTPANAAVLHSLIHLGRALGLTVAADGIEAEQQAHDLTTFGCDEVQGRLLARYLSGEEVTTLVCTTTPHPEDGTNTPA